MTRPGAGTRPAGRSRVAGGRARTWCGAGRFLPTEVMDLAGGVAAGAQTWLRPKEGAGKRTMCFLLGTPRRDFGFCFWCRVIILTCSLTPDKPALVAGWRGRFRRPGRCARARGAHGGRWPGRPTGAGPRRLGDAGPAPASSRAAGILSQDLSLKLLFFFNSVPGTKVTGKSFVKVEGGHTPGPFTASVTEDLPCRSLTRPSAQLPKRRSPGPRGADGDRRARGADGPTARDRPRRATPPRGRRGGRADAEPRGWPRRSARAVRLGEGRRVLDIPKGGETRVPSGAFCGFARVPASRPHRRPF